MRPRIFIIALLLVVVGCGDDADDIGLPATSVPVSTTTSPDDVDSIELPEDPGERYDALLEWLDENHDDQHSGSGFAESDGEVWLQFSVNVAERSDAEALCGFYVENARRFMGDIVVSELTLVGWVRDSDGRYGDAGWNDVTCV